MKIILAEDDSKTSDFLRKGLSQAGYSVECYADGRDALSHCLYNEVDLVVMDRMMPGMDGMAVLKALRAAGKTMPVLFLTSMSDVGDKVEGLMSGADDYLTKPFHFSELLARIVVLARRPTAATGAALVLTVHDLELDLLSRTARRGDTSIDLQPKEFALLEALMRNAGRMITKTMLLEKVWDFSFDPQTSVVETHMSRLRAKIDKPFAVALIHTMRNVGYCIHAPR
ncbi:response regulator [Shinella zoogloeoides]|uniref:response regulator n=1 Tax=Shinella zoogloeoides TaxID=352475 RepID=UPI000E6510B6|nr:response regulator transcription factor [Shinella zoogloeoides]